MENNSFPYGNNSVLMEHPPKQGLKQISGIQSDAAYVVLMEHPPKQGLKLKLTKGVL